MDLKSRHRLQFSQNSTLSRKIQVEEIVVNLESNTTYVRKINCQESYDYPPEALPSLSENGPIVNNAAIQDDSNCAVGNSAFQALNCYFPLNRTNYQTNRHMTMSAIEEPTPMEIDSSSDADNTTTVRKRQRKSNFKKAAPVRSLNATSSRLMPFNKPAISNFTKILVLTSAFLTFVLAYLIIVGNYFVYVNHDVQLENIRKNLKKYVVHQEDAVEIIIHSFERMDSWQGGLKILPFIGSTGVGKTYTVKIIKQQFHPRLVNEINPNQLTDPNKQRNIVENLNSCCCNLIIVDNLRTSDLDDFIYFAHSLPKSFVLLIVPIFNIQETTDGVTHTINEGNLKIIREELDKSKLHFELVLFDVLESHMIETWLRDTLHKRKISEHRHESVVKSLRDDNQVKYKGFKSLNSQLLLSLDDV